MLAEAALLQKVRAQALRANATPLRSRSVSFFLFPFIPHTSATPPRRPPASPSLSPHHLQYFGFGRSALRSALLASSSQQGGAAAAQVGGAARASAGGPAVATKAARMADAQKLDDAAMIELLFKPKQ